MSWCLWDWNLPFEQSDSKRLEHAGGGVLAMRETYVDCSAGIFQSLSY
jgi:hypothetical protein